MFMAEFGQSFSDLSSGAVGGGGQVVVELCGLSGQGLVFWSRQRFEVCTEVQLRLRGSVLPDRLRHCGEAWEILRGVVVQCIPERRSDGSCGFRVCVLVTGKREGAGVPIEADEGVFFKHEWLGGTRMGLN
jgi:hypothetical protein